MYWHVQNVYLYARIWPADLLASYMYKYSGIKWKERHLIDNSLLNPNPTPLKNLTQCRSFHLTHTQTFVTIVWVNNESY